MRLKVNHTDLTKKEKKNNVYMFRLYMQQWDEKNSNTQIKKKGKKKEKKNKRKKEKWIKKTINKTEREKMDRKKEKEDGVK